MNVILADDQYDVRRALKFLLENEVDLQLTSEATNAAELMERLSATCADLVLLDWELPGMSATELVAQMRSVCPAVQVIALSVRPEARQETQQAGVQGFVSKGDPPERLLAAVRKVVLCHSGES